MEPQQDLADRRYGQAMILFAVCLGLLLTLGILTQSFSFAWGLAFTLICLIMIPAVVFVRIKGVPILEGLRIQTVPWHWMLLGLLVGSGAWSVAIFLHSVQEMIGIKALPSGFQVATPAQYGLMMVVAVLLPGICEECLFRGAIQGVLERRGQIFAVVVTSILFGLFHLEPSKYVPAAFLGAVFGWLTVRTGSIVPAMLGHIGNNGTAITSGFLMRDMDALPGWLLPVLFGLFCISSGALWWATKSFSPPKPLLASVPAGLSPLVAWGCGSVSAVLSVLLIGTIVAVTSLVSIVEVEDDALLPHIHSGDQLVLINNGSFAFELSAAETVAFVRDGKTVARVVSRVEGNQVWVREPDDSETALHLDEVIGEMASIVPGKRKPSETDVNEQPSDDE